MLRRRPLSKDNTTTKLYSKHLTSKFNIMIRIFLQIYLILPSKKPKWEVLNRIWREEIESECEFNHDGIDSLRDIFSVRNVNIPRLQCSSDKRSWCHSVELVVMSKLSTAAIVPANNLWSNSQIPWVKSTLKKSLQLDPQPPQLQIHYPLMDNLNKKISLMQRWLLILKKSVSIIIKKGMCEMMNTLSLPLTIPVIIIWFCNTDNVTPSIS